MEHADILKQLRNLYDTKEVVEKNGPSSDTGREWLAKACALLIQVDKEKAIAFEKMSALVFAKLSFGMMGVIWNNMLLIIRGAIEEMELSKHTAKEQIYAAGDAYSIYRDLKEIIGKAKESVFVVDPYADDEIFDLYFAKCKPGTQIRFVTSPKNKIPKSVIEKFCAGLGKARISTEIHDRVIFIDDKDCWVLGQSIKDAAISKPTYLLPIDSVSDMKKLYEDVWSRAKPMSRE